MLWKRERYSEVSVIGSQDRLDEVAMDLDASNQRLLGIDRVGGR